MSTISGVINQSIPYTIFTSFALGSRAVVHYFGSSCLDSMNRTAASAALYVAGYISNSAIYAFICKKKPERKNHYKFVANFISFGLFSLCRDHLTNYRFYPIKQTGMQITQVALVGIGFSFLHYVVKGITTACILQGKDKSYIVGHKTELRIAINAITTLVSTILFYPLLPFYVPMLTTMQFAEQQFLAFAYMACTEWFWDEPFFLPRFSR